MTDFSANRKDGVPRVNEVSVVEARHRTGTWSLDELDAMHKAAGLGQEWARSTRRAELAKTIGHTADRLEALAYECGRRVAIAQSKALLDRVTGLRR